MSKDERVIIVDDSSIARDGLTELLKVYGINIITSVDSVESLKKLLDGKTNATLFTVDNRMPHDGDGAIAAKLIRKALPTAKIIGLSSDDVSYGDVNLAKNISGRDLANTIIRM